MKARLAPLLLALPLLLGACGADQDPVVGAGATTTTEAGTGATTTTATGAGGFATTTISVPSTGRGLLTSVEATHDGDVDRVTFTFEDDVPGYRVGYVDRPIVQDGSGEEILIDGEAVLEVHFEPASGFDLTGEGRQVYRGPTRLDLATTSVLDVARIGDFEAVLAWAIGIDVAQTPFRVRADGKTVIVEVQTTPS